MFTEEQSRQYESLMKEKKCFDEKLERLSEGTVEYSRTRESLRKRCYKLGLLLYEENNAQAIFYLVRAAALECAKAQTKLGDIYRGNDHDIFHSCLESVKYYRQALYQGYQPAKKRLEGVYREILFHVKVDEFSNNTCTEEKENIRGYCEDYSLGLDVAWVMLRKYVKKEKPEKFVQFLLEDAQISTKTRMTVLRQMAKSRYLTHLKKHLKRLTFEQFCYTAAVGIYEGVHGDKQLDEAIKLYQQVTLLSSSYSSAQTDLAYIFFSRGSPFYRIYMDNARLTGHSGVFTCHERCRRNKQQDGVKVVEFSLNDAPQEALKIIQLYLEEAGMNKSWGFFQRTKLSKEVVNLLNHAVQNLSDIIQNEPIDEQQRCEKLRAQLVQTANILEMLKDNNLPYQYSQVLGVLYKDVSNAIKMRRPVLFGQ